MTAAAAPPDAARRLVTESLSGASAADGEEQVGRVGRLDHPGAFEFDRLVTEVVEQPLARTEHHRRDVQPDLVDESCGQVLLDDVGAAADPDLLVPGDRPGPG